MAGVLHQSRYLRYECAERRASTDGHIEDKNRRRDGFVEFLTSLLSHQVANIIFLVLFIAGLGLAIISIVFGNITDAVGGALDGLDGDLSLDADGFGWISFTTICVGISGAGAGGFLFNTLGIPPILVLVIGLAIGVLCAWCAGRFIIIPLKRRQYNGAFDPATAVGRAASVIAPMANGAMGEVMVAGRSLTAKPVSPDQVFSTGDIVQVVRVEGTIALIARENSTERREENVNVSNKEQSEAKET
ncbi:MAG: NfeD family protein [Coriobacteriales bacterium]|jgi:membrane protein implicated in regulation of membrane protease activity|nr:NfeD family protein [Coriobacteriales bacterium]